MENLETQERVLNETRVYRGSDLFKEILPRLRAEFREGALFFLYEDGQKDLADKLIAELKKGGYRLCISCQSEFGNEGASETVPDYARYVFALGATKTAGVAKGVADKLNVGWSLYLTAPDGDDFMCKNAPNQVFIDENVLIKCSCEQIAAGYGILLSKKFSAFEDAFSEKVLSKNVPWETISRSKK